MNDVPASTTERVPKIQWQGDVETTKSLIASRLRHTRGLRSQVLFADRLGMNQQTWSKYEGGEIPDSWLLLARLRDDEGVDLNALLTGRGDAA